MRRGTDGEGGGRWLEEGDIGGEDGVEEWDIGLMRDGEEEEEEARECEEEGYSGVCGWR